MFQNAVVYQVPVKLFWRKNCR